MQGISFDIVLPGFQYGLVNETFSCPARSANYKGIPIIGYENRNRKDKRKEGELASTLISTNVDSSPFIAFVGQTGRFMSWVGERDKIRSLNILLFSFDITYGSLPSLSR